VRQLAVLEQIGSVLEVLGTRLTPVNIRRCCGDRSGACLDALADLVLDEEHDVAEAKVGRAFAAHDEVVGELGVQATVELADLLCYVLACQLASDFVQVAHALVVELARWVGSGDWRDCGWLFGVVLVVGGRGAVVVMVVVVLEADVGQVVAGGKIFVIVVDDSVLV